MEAKIKQEINSIKEGLSHIFPVPIVAIAKKLGIEVLETDEFKDELSGSIGKNDGAYVIYVNKKQSAARRRFTIAHEIGHFLKHKEMIEAGEHVDGIKRPFVLTRITTANGLSIEEKKRESEADTIAAEILMPEDEFKKIWDKSHDIENVSNYFGVSQSAATVRAGVLLKSSIF